jgi:hypothetical protein
MSGAYCYAGGMHGSNEGDIFYEISHVDAPLGISLPLWPLRVAFSLESVSWRNCYICRSATSASDIPARASGIG